MLRLIPLQTLVVVAYLAIAFTVPRAVDSVVLSFTLPSGAPWTLTAGGLLVAIGLVLLYLEVLKSVRATMASLIDHGLSLMLFSICLVLFIVLPQAGTATFFLILVMSLIDVIAGFTVTLAASRRSVDVGTGF
jgi:hypothetical protein